MAALREYDLIREEANDLPCVMENINREAALKVINNARADGRSALTEIEAKQVFEAYDLPVTKSRIATTEEEAVKHATEIGFPIVMKILSPDILHKSDAGGVKVDISNEEEVRQSYNEILKNVKAYKADAEILGIVIQEMAPWGTEVILGSVNDATFGPTAMFGLGGIFVEVLKDVTFKVAPFSQKQAKAMLKEIKAAAILDGVRGEKPKDTDKLAETVCKYANMIVDLKDEIAESDANPVLLYEKGHGLKVADARIILKKK